MNFKKFNDFHNTPEIKFIEGVNLIIGPNGSGKSNLLEIINSIFNKGVIHSFQFKEDYIKQKQRGQPVVTTDCLSPRNVPLVLTPNREKDSNKGTQKIQIQIGLTEQDKNNLKFLKNHKPEFDYLVEEYSKENLEIPNIEDSVIENIATLDLIFDNTQTHKELLLTSKYSSDIDKFILSYLKFFIFFQYIISIANKYENKSWEFLANPFASISSYRNYSNIENQFRVSHNEHDVIQSLKLQMATQPIIGVSTSEPIVFNYIRTVLGFRFHSMVSQHGSKSHPDSNSFKDPLFVELNKKLNEILKLEIFIKKFDENSLDYWFQIRNSQNKEVAVINELSAGEKGLLHFIFVIFGYNLENGVMVIDEPEIHLHPQMQEKCLDLLHIMTNSFSVQFIVVTHSPILVNYEIIGGVQRFYKTNNETKIISPKFTNQIQDLVRYLNYTRATKVLFGNHVVLTEGDSDAYFYKFFYEKFKINNSKLVDLEFLNMGGVYYRKPWKKFFESWEIKWFLIRDKDHLEITETEITKKYDEGEFILKNGDLESYIGKQFKKKLANVVKFCESQSDSEKKSEFEIWFTSEENKTRIEELKTIFTKISEVVKTL